MAVNRQRGLIDVVTQSRVVEPNDGAFSKGAFRVAQSGSSEASTAVANALQTQSRQLATFATQIGAVADHAANVEGSRAGKTAGLDPEFRPRRDGTIRGEAYDRAGLQTYQGMVRLEVQKDIAAGGDLGAKRAGWLKRVPPELHPEVAFQFSSAEVVEARKLARAEEKRIRGEQLATAHNEVETQSKGLHQRAYALGLDETATEILDADLGLLQKRLQQVGPDGKPLVDPLQAAKVLAQAKETVTNARLLGAFERLETNEERISFIKKIEDDFAASKGLAKNYDLQGFERITGRLESSLRRSLAAERQGKSALAKEIKTLIQETNKGDFAPTVEQLDGLRARVLAEGSSASQAELEKLESLATLASKLRAARPAEIRASIEAQEEAQQLKGVDPEGIARLRFAKEFLVEQGKQLQEDQLGYADKVQYTDVVPLDFSSDTAIAKSFAIRVAQAEDVAKHYHGAAWKSNIQYLQPEDKRRLAALASQGGADTQRVAGFISKHAGDEAPAILAEVFGEAPVFAVLGGLVHRVGTSSITNDIVDGIALAKSGRKLVAVPTANEASVAAKEVAKGTLFGLGENEAAMIDATNLAYQLRVQRLPGQDKFNEKLWKRTFREVLGENSNRKGEVFGGVVLARPGWLFGGTGAVIVPPEIQQDRFLELVSKITLADVEEAYGRAGGLPRYFKDGAVQGPVSEGDFRNATLEQDGDGTYVLNLGDETAPQYLVTRERKHFVLDMRRLEPLLREKYPEFYKGGGPLSQRRVSQQANEDARQARIDSSPRLPSPGTIPEPSRVSSFAAPAPLDDRVPAARQGMISGTAVNVPELAAFEGALQEIEAYESGDETAVTGADYHKMLPWMQQLYESNGLDVDALEQLLAIFGEIEGRL